MKSYRFPQSTLDLSCLVAEEYSMLPEAADLNKRLSDAKNLLDDPYKDPRYRQVTDILDYYKSLRYIVGIKFNGQNASNAWLKMYELVNHFGLITKDTKTYFGNSEMPGSFIMAFNHYNKTRNAGVTQWYASSIVAKDEAKNYLEDRYHLWKRYPDRWLMGGENNGDTTVVANIEDFARKLQAKSGGLADLYTSDAGIDVSSDWNDQERMEAKIHLGQTVAALETLRTGGNMALKTFTYFEPFSLGLLHILRGVFTELYICKPRSSRPSNSETYIVGKGYLGTPPAALKMLKARLDKFTFAPLVSRKCIYDDKPFMDVVKKSWEIFENQIRVVKENVAYFHKYKDDIPGLVNAYRNKKQSMITEYLNDNKIAWLDDSDKLEGREEIARNKKGKK